MELTSAPSGRLNKSIHRKKHNIRAIRLIVFLLFVITRHLHALPPKNGDSSYPKRNYQTLRTDAPPVIDGKLDDMCWLTGEWQTNYTQFTPVYKGKPSRRTDLKILYNDKSMFVAIRAWDNMKEITKRLGRRDNFLGDIVGVQFDSYYDHRTAFEFDMTAAGQKIDVWLQNDGWDVNWNAIWDGKVAYEDSAWTAELEIPLSQLRYGVSGEQVWGLDSWRRIDRLQEEDHWNLVANDGTGIVYTFGELHGLTGLKKNRRIELSPYASAKLTTDKKIEGHPYADGSNFDWLAGLDAKIGITNNFTLDATINPDFGQVEADPSVMNLSAFETYFEEKRPFFTEGKNIFDFTFDGEQLFYSRRIGHAPSYTPPFDTMRMPEFTTIGAAYKLSGKTSRGLSLGVMESITTNEYADIYHDSASNKQVAEPLSNYFVARFQKDYDKGNTIIGGIFTNAHRFIQNSYLEFLSRNATTAGIDITRYWKDRKYFLEWKAAGSNIRGDHDAMDRMQSSSARYMQRPDYKGVPFDTSRTVFSGLGTTFRIGKWSKGHWRYNEALMLRTPGLELNDIGYMNLANEMSNSTNIGYYERTNTRIFKTYTFNLQQENKWDAQGTHLYSGIGINIQSEFMNGWNAQASGQYKFESLDEWLLRGGPAMRMPAFTGINWIFQSNAAKRFYVGTTGTWNKGSINNFSYFNVTADISWRAWPNLLLSVQPNFMKNVDEQQYVAEVHTNTSESTWLLGKMDNRNLGFAFRVDYAITPECTIQYYGSPFVSIAKYTGFKKVIDQQAKNYYDRFVVLEPTTDGELYYFDENNDGVTEFSISNPDFNYQQFRSNLVVRWEYKTGSAIYLVWSQDKTQYQPQGSFDFHTGFENMMDIHPRNVFMIKFNYLLKL